MSTQLFARLAAREHRADGRLLPNPHSALPLDANTVYGWVSSVTPVSYPTTHTVAPANILARPPGEDKPGQAEGAAAAAAAVAAAMRKRNAARRSAQVQPQAQSHADKIAIPVQVLISISLVPMPSSSVLPQYSLLIWMLYCLTKHCNTAV